MPDELEAPDDPEDLYLARGSDVTAARPLLTGDVVDGIAIPGLDDDAGLAIIVTHPCSMRQDGVKLAARLLTARVETYRQMEPEQWQGHWKVMPLPELTPTDNIYLAARLDKIGLVPSDVVATAPRIACLTPYGVNLLQQRFVWHLTRFCASTTRLNQASAAVFEEADLHEEWVRNPARTRRRAPSCGFGVPRLDPRRTLIRCGGRRGWRTRSGSLVFVAKCVDTWTSD